MASILSFLAYLLLALAFYRSASTSPADVVPVAWALAVVFTFLAVYQGALMVLPMHEQEE